MTIVREAMGDTAVNVPTPSPGRPQPPIYPLRVGNHGGWLEVRSDPSDGSCGVSGYPCKHPGLDVYGPRGTPVVAPENGTIVMVANGASPPFTGYGPWLVILQGASGKFHLLSHLDPATSALGPMGARVSAGTKIGTTSSANHTHWEVRTRITPPSGATNFTNNVDPIGWLRGQSSLFVTLLVAGGAVLAYLIAQRQAR